MVSTSLVALKEASTVEAVVLVKLDVVTAVPWRAKVLAVTVPLIAGSDAIVTLLEIDAVTEPIWAVPATRAGREAMVTLFPIVTEEMLIGTVPLMDAVTEPICAVPAPRVTVPAPIVTTPMRFVPAGRAEPMVTVPEIASGILFPDPSCIGRIGKPLVLPTLCTPPGESNATATQGRPEFASKSVLTDAVTVPEMAGRELTVTEFPTVTVPPTVTALALNCTSVRPPVTVTCPMVTVMLSSALSDVGPSSTVPVTVLLVA